MPFTINEFRDRFKAGLPSSFYEVTMVPPGANPEAAREITLRTESINLPGTSFFSVDNYSPYGNGLTYNIPYRYNPQEITMIHNIDEDGKIYSTFRKWTRRIIDVDGDEQFGAYYHKNYETDAYIYVYNHHGENTNIIKLVELYPINIDPVQMSWGATDEYAKLSVTYRFTRFSVLK